MFTAKIPQNCVLPSKIGYFEENHGVYGRVAKQPTKPRLRRIALRGCVAARSRAAAASGCVNEISLKNRPESFNFSCFFLENFHTNRR